MQLRKTLHVIPNLDGSWDTRHGGSWRSSGRFEKKKQALAHALEISRSEDGELVVHHRDGRITHHPVHTSQHEQN